MSDVAQLKMMTMLKNLKQIVVCILVSVIMIAVCGADSLGPITVGVIFGVCYMIWRVLKLNEVFQDINDGEIH